MMTHQVPIPVARIAASEVQCDLIANIQALNTNYCSEGYNVLFGSMMRYEIVTVHPALRTPSASLRDATCSI